MYNIRCVLFEHRESWDARNVLYVDLEVHIDLEDDKIKLFNCTLKKKVCAICGCMLYLNTQFFKKRRINSEMAVTLRNIKIILIFVSHFKLP